MGIKGIYKEIGAGTRVSFCRLGVDSLETRDRPLRLAIDISIWQFQVQAARGGANPAIRTLFYRLVRLLGLPIHPVFVFDGPNKPVFKRNKRSGTGDGMATAMAKRLIRLFGFVVHDAPGEAEAECALLQQRGVVDAVLSEDVDTLMFGCIRSLRNWSAAKGATSPPTHVSMYEAVPATPEAPPSHAGLDREGMVLIALMSGGDYHPEGVPGCGIKLACEAAKAGFGRSLCRLKRSDTQALVAWRDRLTHELRTNESRFFRTCHHKLCIPEAFPSLEVLRYYTHPVVSPSEVVERVRADLAARETAASEANLDLVGLRAFVAETFDWTNRDGAIKFIRVLAPSLLARILLLRWSADCGDDSTAASAPRWPSVVEGISKQRAHVSTDETPELRVAFVPVTVVGLDLDAENDAPAANFGRDGLALNSDDEFDEPALTQAELGDEAPATAMRKAAPYDPTQTDVAWVPKVMVEMGAPQAVEAWEAKQRKKGGAKKATAKGKEKAVPASSAGSESTSGRRKPRTRANAGMQAGSLDRYMQATNIDDSDAKAAEKAEETVKKTVSRRKPREVEKAKTAEEPPEVQVLSSDEDDVRLTSNKTTKTSARKPQPQTPQKAKAPVQTQKKAANPWAMSGSQMAPRVTKSNGGNGSRSKKAAAASQPPKEPIEVVDLLSSPAEPTKMAGTPARMLTNTPTKTQDTKRRQTTAPSQPAGTPRQTSIKDFLTRPVAVVSDAEDKFEDTEDMVIVSRVNSPSPVPPPESSTRTKTVYVPRRSAVGYFREEIVDEDDVDARAVPPGRPRRGWRESEVDVVDLTGLGGDYEII